MNITMQELAALLARRITNQLKVILDETDGPTDEDARVIGQLSTWLIDSGMVTEQTMFADSKGDRSDGK